MTASSLRVMALIVALSGCSAAQSTQGNLMACIDPISESLNVTIRNASSTDLVVASESPQLGCCAINELSLFVADREGTELKHCSFLDHFSPMKTQVLRSGEAKSYSLSLLGVETHYCGIEAKGNHLVAVFRAQRSKETEEVLRASGLIRPCAE
jgi:hypothetical protein